jgi:hypothetical protein
MADPPAHCIDLLAMHPRWPVKKIYRKQPRGLRRSEISARRAPQRLVPSSMYAIAQNTLPTIKLVSM